MQTIKIAERSQSEELSASPGETAREPSRRWLAGMLLAATLLGAGLRFYHLGAASFWEDELKTVRDCGRLGEINRSKVFGYLPTAIGLRLQGISPGEIPIKNPERWQALGINEGRARLASAVIGVISIPCLALACYPLVGARAAGVLALLLAVAPWHIYWSQAARFYTQQFLFYNLCLIWYFRATQSGSWPRMLAAASMLTLSFLTQPPSLVILAVIGGDWLLGLVRREPVRLGWAGWIGIPIALAVCLLVLSLDVRERTDQWAQFVGDTSRQSPGKMVFGSVFMIMPVVAMAAVMFFPSALRVHRRLGIYLLLAGVIPILAFALVATMSYVGLRYTFVSLLPWLAVAAIGCVAVYDALRHRLGRLAAAAPLGLLLVAMVYQDFVYYTAGYGYHERWRDAFAYVARHRQPGERVYVPAGLIASADGKTRVFEGFIGPYYLQDGSIIAGLPKEDQLRELKVPAWLVVEVEDPLGRRRERWLDNLADLKSYFNLRVVSPSSFIHVYRYVPGEGPGAGSGADYRPNEPR